MNVRKLHNDKFDSKKAAKVGLDASLKTSIIPDDAVIDLLNLVRDYYYFKDLQSAIVLKLHAELKASFPTYLKVFSKVTIQTSLKLLEAYPLAADMLAAPYDTQNCPFRQTICHFQIRCHMRCCKGCRCFRACPSK